MVAISNFATNHEVEEEGGGGGGGQYVHDRSHLPCMILRSF